VRILYILTSLGIGGAEKQVIDLAARMAARGHTVAFLVLKHADEEWPVKLPVLRLNIRKTLLGIYRGLQFAAKFAALFRPDILHSHTFPANLFARLLKPMLRVEGHSPCLINTIHNVDEGGWHRMFLYRITDTRVDQVTAVSSAAAERFVRLHAISAGKMHVLTNGIDTEAFTPNRTRRKQARIEMQAGGNFIWLAIGRLAPAKDYPNLLRAFEQVRHETPKTILWIAGEGDPAYLQQAMNEMSGVQLLGLRPDIAELLDAADGYVLSSAWEGMPLALAEAMAMEKPVVATDVGGVRELVCDAGFVVPPHDSNALAQAMLKAMQLTEKARKEIGRDARNRVQLHFSMNEKAVEWEQLYMQVASRKNA
jgi:glycosyltransferase involved in cell wall biosynthesis